LLFNTFANFVARDGIPRMGLNSTFLPYLAGGLTIRPTKTKLMKFGEGIAVNKGIK